MLWPELTGGDLWGLRAGDTAWPAKGQGWVDRNVAILMRLAICSRKYCYAFILAARLISADRKAVPFSCIYPFYLPCHRNPQLIDNVQDVVCHGNRALVLYVF